MSPMCWLSQAYFPSATASVFFRSAPTARVGGTADRQRDRQRRVSAGAPDRQLDTVDHPHDRVVARHQDRPVMHQPAVGEPRKPFERIVVGEADRLTAEVARRHHQCSRAGLVAGQPEQQHVQRRVGQHDAEVGVVRGHRVGDRGARRGRGMQHDRALRHRTAAAPTASSTSAMRARRRPGRRTITANGLSPRRLRLRSSATARSLAASQARWYPPMPLTASDAAVAQQLPGLPQPDPRGSVDAAVARLGSAASGPQFGQQTGWAWKRRSAGSAYSRAQSAHIAKARHGGRRRGRRAARR